MKPRSVIICERQKQFISCPNGRRIDVLNANYGRMASETCSHPSIQSTNCRSNSSPKHVQDKCNGKSSCELHASNSEFGDPCPGTHKYLEVKYRCLEYISLGKREMMKYVWIMPHTAPTVGNVSWPWLINAAMTHAAGNVGFKNPYATKKKYLRCCRKRLLRNMILLRATAFVPTKLSWDWRGWWLNKY